MDRGAGILMHIASLPGKFGIGTLGSEAYKFADFIHKSGLKYWQILPLGQTSYGDSPYQCFSAFSGNPYFIDYDILKDDGLLEEEDYINENYGVDEEYIDYGTIYSTKFKVLKKAYSNFKGKNDIKLKKDIEVFKKENEFWLDDYSLYMALKNNFNQVSWYNWDEDIKRREEKAILYYKELLKDETEYWCFIQYLFFTQWKKLKAYVNNLGIKIIGDIPIYVAEDSVDTWSSPKGFKINHSNLEPISVSGCPPDAYAVTGQLWGNLIYNWDYFKKNGYKWWITRINESLKLYDIVRIDHFRGFESFWEIPYGEKTAVNGKWVKGPGIELFKSIKKELGEVNVIAEDLGFMTDDVRLFLKESGFPGMRVLQFGFDGEPYNMFLPHMYVKNCIAYTGTHDNDTILGWYENLASKKEKKNAKIYLGLNKSEGYNWGFLRGIWSSVADVAIAQMQDFLGLGSESRINIPSTLGNNWKWRAKEEAINDNLAKKIYKFTVMFGR